MAGKPSLAEVTATAEPDDMGGEDEGAEKEGYDAAVSELADVMGIPDDKMEAFKSAFEAAVMNCR